MGLLSTLFSRPPAAYYVSQGVPPRDPALVGMLGGGGDTAAGVSVTEWSALNLSAVWAAVNLLASCIGMSAITLTKKTGPHIKTPAVDHPVYELLAFHPYKDCTPYTWTQSRQGHLCTWGNAYAHIQRNGRGQPLPGGLTPLGPHRVQPETDQRGLFYRVSDLEGGEKIVPGEDMIHVPGLGFNGVVGYSVVQYARESLGLLSGTERGAASFHGNNSTPTGLLISKSALKDKARQELRESFEKSHKGPTNRGRMAVLWGDLDYKQLGLSPDDAQFMQTRIFQVVEIARWFNVPPHLIRDLTRSTNNNIVQQSLEFIIYSLGPWITVWKQELEKKLLTPEERLLYCVDFDTEPLLRGDGVALNTALNLQRQNGVISADEWRSKIGMNPTEDGSGQHYLVNGNMIRADVAGTPPAPEPAADKPMAASAAGVTVVLMPDVPDFPDVRQTHNYDCGAANTRGTCELFEVVDADVSEETFIEQLGTTPADGTQPPAIIDLCTRLGLMVTAGHMEIEDLRGFCKKGWVIICPVEMYGPGLDHYVTVLSVAVGQVIYHDPARVEGRERDKGRDLMSEDDFLSAWYDRDGEVPPEDAAYRQYGIAVGPSLEVAVEQEATPPDAAKGAAPPSEAQAKRGTLITAQRAVVVDALGRMVRRECAAARRAAKTPATFGTWVDAFYSTYSGDLERALLPALTSHAALCGTTTQSAASRDCAAAHVLRSRTELLAMSGHATAATLAAETDALCAGWERDRANALADTLMGEELDHAE